MMSKHLFVVFLALGGNLAGSGDEPRQTPKPPYQRLLQGDDAKRAAALMEQIKAVEQADQYDEAIERCEELLALRTRVQGADHWETVNDHLLLETFRKVAAQPAEKRASWHKAVRGSFEANELEAKGQYARAEPLWQDYRQWCLEVLGEKHCETATSYNNLAMNLNAQGKFANAKPLFRKALDLRLEL